MINGKKGKMMGKEESVSRRATTFLGRHCFGGRWTQPCDLDSRVATTEKDHGEEKDGEQERNEMTIINEHTISSSTSMRIESPPLQPNTFCLLPFTSYPSFSLQFHRSSSFVSISEISSKEQSAFYRFNDTTSVAKRD